MEDIIQALLDVVRIQHGEADGTEVEPFNMEDVIDMAMNIIGRPEEKEEETALIKEIEKTVESIAPDIFPPKTFDQLDDSEQVASAASMIEQSLFSGSNSRQTRQDTPAESDQSEDFQGSPDVQAQMDAYNHMSAAESEGEDDFNASEAADLNNMIYDNIMKMMGLTEPKVEDAFDRSQIRFGKEKSITELLEEEQNNGEDSGSPARPLSAWELAQNAIDKDIEAHTKEEYIPKPMEMPNTTSASQLAAEAIKKAREEDDKRSEIEKRADALMEEARKLGKDPMQFALHQQEILRYMEKNSDELVSFEDYEDLTPEEKLEIERALEEEKRQAAAAQADNAGGEDVPAGKTATSETATPEAAIPKATATETVNPEPVSPETSDPEEADSQDNGDGEEIQTPPLTEEMLLKLSQEVIRENSDMILADNADEDMEGLNAAIMENIRKMMSGAGVPVHQESVDSLMDQVMGVTSGGGGSQEDSQETEAQEVPETSGPDKQEETAQTAETAEDTVETTGQLIEEKPGDAESGQEADAEETPEETAPLSAAELAKAAQKAAGIRTEEVEERPMLSAVELAKIAQQAAQKLKDAEETGQGAIELDESDLNFEDLDFDLGEEGLEEDGQEEESQAAGTPEAASEESSENPEEESEESEEASQSEGQDEEDSDIDPDDLDDIEDSDSPEGESHPEEMKEEETEAEEYDVEVFVLGEHTQAEVDEALRNLETLGLEGEVYDRAERLLLLEMAGSEAELDAWLAARDAETKPAEASPLYDDQSEDLTDIDADEMELELDQAFEEELEDEENSEEDSGEDSEEASEEEAFQDEETEGEQEESQDQEAEEDGTDQEDQAEEGSEDEESAEETEPAEAPQESPEPEVFEEETLQEETSQSEAPQPEAGPDPAQEYQVSVRGPIILKNSASFMDQFEDYISESQENRRLSTGFRKLDAMLRYGLHKGSYFIDSDPQYLKNAFMQQIADRTAENGIDVLYISTELSRYDLMVESVSRLSYEIHSKDGTTAVSPMDIMSGKEGANLIDLKDELNWYRGRISEHLFIVDQEAVMEVAESADEEAASAGAILEELIRSIVRDGAHKPVVVIDNLENVLPSQDSEDMAPLMEGMRKLARELGIPILMSCGYSQAESDEMLDPAEMEFHRSLGGMCDVYLDLRYADMITEDGRPLTQEDIKEMAEHGETVLLDVYIRRNRRSMRASCQIQAAPRYNYFADL